MDIEEKRKIASAMTCRAAELMEFMNDYLWRFPDVVDQAYLRSLHVLLCYSFELILKSRVVILSDAFDINKLDKKLQKPGHNFEKISNELKNEELRGISIKSIEFKGERCNRPEHPKGKHGYYRVETISDKEIRIEDFNDIRYDFLCERVRYVDSEEHKKIIGYIDVLNEIHRKVKVANNKIQ